MWEHATKAQICFSNIGKEVGTSISQYWTLTPYNNTSSGYYYTYFIYKYGYLLNTTVVNKYGIRPVIELNETQIEL